MSPVITVLHRTVWSLVGLAFVLFGLYVIATEAYVKNDAINDLFISKSDILLYGSSVMALGGAILLLTLFFWRSRRSRRGGTHCAVAR